MKCVRCQKTEATYDVPDNWCDDCWNDWWFDMDYHMAKMVNFPEHKRKRAALQIVVERVFWEFGEDGQPTNNEIIRRAHELAVSIKFTDKEIEDEIIRQQG